jgi:hypothetical protein
MLKRIIILSLLFLLPISQALEYRDYCSDNQTLNRFMNFTSCENVTCIDYNFTQNINCVYGCDNSTMTCNPSPTNQYLYVGLTLIGLLIVIVIVVKVSRR